MKLELIPIKDFAERKASKMRGLKTDRWLDKEFGTLITDLNSLPFLYTKDSCYGKFGAHHYFNPQGRRNEGYLTGYLSFGLDYSDESRRFFQGVKDIENRHLYDCLLIDDALLNFGEEPKRFKPNEFCFGIVPLDKERVRVMPMELAVFKTVEEARKFEPIRDQIWEEWRELARKSQ